MKREQGFSLIEALVALSILTTALVPTYIIALRSVDIAFSIRNNVVAANLAQEGVEVVRAIRDGSWFTSTPFFNGVVPDGNYSVVWNSNTLMPYDPDVTLRLGANGTYSYEVAVGGEQTPFRRRISVLNIPSEHMQVQSTVFWTERGRDKSVTVESHLFNWK